MTTYPTIEKIATHFKYWPACYVTSTTGGQHAPGSYHYRGEAVDFGCGLGNASQQAALHRFGKTRWEVMDELAAFFYAHSGHLTELVHTRPGDTSGWYVKNGHKVPHGFYGHATDVAHENHVHVAIATQTAANEVLRSVSGNTIIVPPPASQPSGMTNREIQIALVRDGFKVGVDGVFGPRTKTAVEAFQKEKGLAPDGIVGPLTAAALRAVK